jgi:hypothetical protein
MRFLKSLTGLSLAVGAMAAATSASASGVVTTTFQSQFGLPTYTADPAQGGTLLGPSEEVCLEPSASDRRCPTGGVSYNTGGGDWGTAGLSDYPLAHFMWAPGISGQTFPADLAGYAFSRSFYLPGTPVNGTIRIAADDFADVRVNGVSAGSIGSVTDISAAADAQSYLHAIDLTPFLHQGANVITVVGQNGPASYPGPGVCGDACSYSSNPAMVVFTGSLTSVSAS